MLIKCPECQLQLSDKALFCPHCGYTSKDPQKQIAKSSKRKRLPNGFGQITRLKGRNLRKPYRAMVTVGKTSEGKPICKLLKPQAYFETYNEAYSALVEYNKSPYDSKKDVTILELYNEWKEWKYKRISKSSAATNESSWKYCEPLYDMLVREVKTYHIKECIDKCGATGNIKTFIKAILNQLFDYAVECGLVETNYARNLKLNRIISQEELITKESHMIYTDKEMEYFWSFSNRDIIAQMILVQCYSGWRPQELCLLKVEDVDLDNWTFKGGMKTKAGTNRIVPIHEKIKGIVKRNVERAKKWNSETLFFFEHPEMNGVHSFTYLQFYSQYRVYISGKDINPKHKPHDGRKHFVTLAKKYGVDAFAIKRMVGHAIEDITEEVYTERSVEWLAKELSKIEE